MTSDKVKQAQLTKKINEFKKKNPGFMILQIGEGGITSQTKKNDINEQFLLTNEKLNIFEKSVLEKDLKLLRSIMEEQYGWMGGQTSCSDYIFDRHIKPNLKKAKKFISLQKYKDAFPIMYAICAFLLFHGDDCIRDNETYIEQEDFVQIFIDISENWKTLIEQSYQSMGMFNQQTKDNIIDFLKSVERNLNSTLSELYDDFDFDKFPRIEIFATHQPQTEQDEEDNGNNSNNNSQEGEDGKYGEKDKNLDDQISISSKILSQVRISDGGEDQEAEKEKKSEEQQVMDLQKFVYRNSQRKKDLSDKLSESREKLFGKKSQKSE